MNNFTDQVTNRLKAMFPDRDTIALHEPCFNDLEKQFVKDCIDSTFVSSIGKYVDKFEQMLSEFTGAKYVIAVMNGTAALHIALKMAGVGPGDEVLVPALCFVATPNTVTYLGAIPHFVDSDYNSLGLDPNKLLDYLSDIGNLKSDGLYNCYTGNRIRAIVPVHTFGHSVNMNLLCEVCDRFNIVIIEDAAEALGSFYQGTHVGTIGKAGTLSFNGNKIITTGGGGAILTNDESIGKWAKHITTTAKIPHQYIYSHDQTGYNYRMPNINAALGCAQMERLASFIENKRKLAKRYALAFKDMQGVHFFTEPVYSKSNYWLNTLIFDRETLHHQQDILEETNTNGIMTRPVWKLMTSLPMYKECPHMNLNTAHTLEKQIINIPSSSFL